MRFLVFAVLTSFAIGCSQPATPPVLSNDDGHDHAFHRHKAGMGRGVGVFHSIRHASPRRQRAARWEP